jgi:hypothetical protein
MWDRNAGCLISKRDHNRVNVITSRADEHIVECSRACWCHKAACRGMTKRVALYARVSVGNGAQTVENQLRDLQEVAVRLGWKRPELNSIALYSTCVRVQGASVYSSAEPILPTPGVRGEAMDQSYNPARRQS